MSQKFVKVRIPRKGMAAGKAEIVVEAEGFVGEGCKAATEAFAQLGTDVTNEDKPELYQTTDGQQFLMEGE